MTGEPQIPAPRWRHFRPQLDAIGPGVGSYIEGKYYFDGVQIHLELGIQMASTGAGFVGNSPTFHTPSAMEITTPAGVAMILGVGHAHDATTGSIHPIAGRRGPTSPTAVTFYYWSGSAYVPVTTSTPVTWGILDGLYIKLSYTPVVKAAPRNFVAFGDSITRFENTAGYVGDINWTAHVPVADELVFGGGFARDSATSAIVLANAKRMNADVAVCMVGVNDIAQGVPQSTTLANVLALKDKVQADKFVLCKIPPYNAHPSAVASLNDAYAALAIEHGMTLIDPYANYRQDCGEWATGASGDGVHPTAAVQQAVAPVFRAGILAALATEETD